MTSEDKPDNKAAEKRFGTRDKDVGWYSPTLDGLTEAQRDLLEKYSHVPSDRVIPHIYEMRDRAWEIYPYPCIGQFRFIDISVSLTPSYPLILERLRKGETLLDLGCCFAQDIRKLVHDGAPAENLWGVELEAKFIELSYEMFRDKDTLKANFLIADIFDPEGPLKQLQGKFDMAQIGLFLHLFDLAGQTQACENIVNLMKPEKGILIVGQQIGGVEPGQIMRGTGSKMYKHNMASFEKMWKEVGEKTGTQWKVTAHLDEGVGIGNKKRTWDDPQTRRLKFEIERIS